MSGELGESFTEALAKFFDHFKPLLTPQTILHVNGTENQSPITSFFQDRVLGLRKI